MRYKYFVLQKEVLRINIKMSYRAPVHVCYDTITVLSKQYQLRSII